MNDATKRSEQEKMVQAGLITADDALLDGVRVTLIDGPLGIFCAQGWWAYFTNEKIVLFMGSGLGFGGFSNKGKVIPYKSIKGIKKCPYMIFPLGTAIDFDNPDTSASDTEKIYFGPGGGKWERFIAEKAGISQA